MNKIKKCFSLLTSAALMASMASMLPVTAEETGAYGLTVVEVSKLEDFKNAVTADKDCCIKLTKDISASQDTKSKSTDAYFTVGKGHKVIDLNGKDLKVSDNRTGEDYLHLAMFEVGSGAKVEINDKDNKGKIVFNGYLISNDSYKIYSVNLNRDIFHVDGGDLIINGGTLDGGRSKDEYVYQPAIYDEDGSLYGAALFGDYTHYPRKNINATAVDMDKGSVTINGGQLYGRGIDDSSHTSEQDPSSGAAQDKFNFVRNGVVEADGGTLTVNYGVFFAKSGADVFKISGSTEAKILSCACQIHKNDEILIKSGGIMKGSYGDFGIPEDAVDKAKTTVYSNEEADEPAKVISPSQYISSDDIEVTAPISRMVYINEKKGFDTKVSYNSYFPDLSAANTNIDSKVEYSVTVYDQNSQKVGETCTVGTGAGVKFNTFTPLLEPIYTKLLPNKDYIMQIDVTETYKGAQVWTMSGFKTLSFSVTDKSPVEITQQPAAALADMQGKQVTLTAVAQNAEKVKWYKVVPGGSTELVSEGDVGSDGKAELKVAADGELYLARFSNTGKNWVTTNKARAGFKPTFRQDENTYTPYQHDTLKIDFLCDYDTSRYADLIESDDIYVSSNGGDFEKLTLDNNFVYSFSQFSIINVNFTDVRKYQRRIVLKDGTTYDSPVLTVKPNAEAGASYITDFYITGFEDLCIGDKATTAEDITVYSDKYNVKDVQWNNGVSADGKIVSSTPSCYVIFEAKDGYSFKSDESREIRGYIGTRSAYSMTSEAGEAVKEIKVYYGYDNHVYLTEPKDTVTLTENRFIIQQYSDVDIQLEPIVNCPKQHEEKHTITKMEEHQYGKLPKGLTIDNTGHITGVCEEEELQEDMHGYIEFTFSNDTTYNPDIYFTIVEHEHEYVTTVDENGDTHINCKHADLCGCKEIVIKGSVTVHHFGEWTDAKDGTHVRKCTDEGCETKEVQPHTWDEGVTTKEATKDAEGVCTYTCTVCGATRTEAVPYEGKDDSSKPDDSIKPDNSSKPDDSGEVKALKGDVTRDGKIDIDDAVTIISHINGIKAMTNDQMKIGNVEGEDKTIDIADAVCIINHINGVKAIAGYVSL